MRLLGDTTRRIRNPPYEQAEREFDTPLGRSSYFLYQRSKRLNSCAVSALTFPALRAGPLPVPQGRERRFGTDHFRRLLA
jgi:hypothetical protein